MSKTDERKLNRIEVAKEFTDEAREKALELEGCLRNLRRYKGMKGVIKKASRVEALLYEIEMELDDKESDLLDKLS